MSARARLFVIPAALFLAGLLAMLAFLQIRYAHAQDAGIGPALTEAAKDVAAVPVSTGPCIDKDGPGPAPCIASPLDEPRAYFDAGVAAERLGWPVLVGVLVFGALVLAGQWFPYFTIGKRALLISGGVAMTAAAVNAGFDGGSWYAMLAAALAMGLKLVQGDRTAAALLASHRNPPSEVPVKAGA